MGDAQRIGVMGGTFDPIHHGHLVAASEVAQPVRAGRGGLRAHRPAVAEGRPDGQRRRGPLPDDGDRHRVEPAVHGQPGRHRPAGGPTYTIDTLRDLRAERGADVELFFITGADALAQILSWQDVDELFALAHFVGVTRPGYG